MAARSAAGAEDDRLAAEGGQRIYRVAGDSLDTFPDGVIDLARSGLFR